MKFRVIIISSLRRSILAGPGPHSDQAALLKVGFVLLDLDHEMVEVDELGADGQAAERRLVQDLMKAVVVLDELSQSALYDAGSVFEVGEGPHDVLTHRLHRLLPGAGKPSDQLSDPSFFILQSV